MAEMDIKTIALIVFGIIIIYLLYKTRKIQSETGKIEGFAVTEEMEKAITKIYNADIDAIRNLSDIATKITKDNDSLTIPVKNTIISGNTTVSGALSASDLTATTNIFASGRNILGELNELKISKTGAVKANDNAYIKGPFSTSLPVKGEEGIPFTVPIAGNYLLNVCASAWSVTRDTMIIIQIWINGVNTENNLRIWANPKMEHMLLVPVSFKYPLTAGTNHLFLRQVTGISDQNDFASFSFIY
jgi:hypothetical protein